MLSGNRHRLGCIFWIQFPLISSSATVVIRPPFDFQTTVIVGGYFDIWSNGESRRFLEFIGKLACGYSRIWIELNKIRSSHFISIFLYYSLRKPFLSILRRYLFGCTLRHHIFYIPETFRIFKTVNDSGHTVMRTSHVIWWESLPERSQIRENHQRLSIHLYNISR